ncbi:MAG: hypothetical protein HQ543_03335, partial [Bacteroidetes bacterium]|nr:hypothetical protein [Bacteroidota bacterium]
MKQKLLCENSRLKIHAFNAFVKRKIGGVNSKFVLEKSTGEYFMWAADDDKWELIFVESCLSELFQQGDKKSFPKILHYHMLALKDIADTIDLLSIDQTIKHSLKIKARDNIIKHFTYFITRQKPK